MNRIFNWLKNGNNCDKCGAIWEEWSAYHEDCDCGCYIKGYDYDENPCRIPRIIRWLLVRRAKYFKNHEYDGFEEFIVQQDDKNKKIMTAIKDIMRGWEICYKDINGKYIPCDIEDVIDDQLYKIRDACAPEWQPPLTLRKKWELLLKESLLWLPSRIKPFVCR